MDEEQIQPEETVVEMPKRKGGRPKGSGVLQKAKAAAASSGMTAAEVTEMMKTLVAEMKKPSDLEQKKLDDEKQRSVKTALARANEAKLTAEEKRQQIAHCQHIRPDGKHTFVGQVNSDGFIRGTCIRCPFEFGPIMATQHQKEQGAGLELREHLTATQLSALTLKALKDNPQLRNSMPSWKIA